MKKIIAFLFCCLFFFNVFAQSKTVSVGILIDKSTEKTAPLLKRLQNEISVVVGRQAEMKFSTPLESNYDLGTANANYKKLIETSDLILSFGVINTIALYNAKEYEKPVIVFGSINSDFIPISPDQKTSGIDNINYIITPQSYTEDLTFFESLYDYKNIGIIVDEFLPNTLPVKQLFDDYFSKKESSYKLITMDARGQLGGSLEGLDAVYLAGGFNLSDTDFEQLAKSINERKLPSFSSISKRDVERGILLSNQPEGNIDLFLRRLALNVEAVVSGKNPSELPLQLDFKKKISLNFETANEIEFPLKYSMLANTDFIGGGTHVISNVTYSLVDVMKEVVGDNLALNAEKKNIDLSNQDVKTSRSNFLPNLTAAANATYVDPELAQASNGSNPEFSTSGNVALNQTIYSESAAANISIQKNLLKAQTEAYNSAQLDALLNISIAYFNALILKTNVYIQNQNLQITKRNLEISEQNFEAGASGKGDVLRFKSQLAQNMQSLVNADNSLRQAFFEINQQLNNKISDKIDVEDAEVSKGIFKNYNYKEFLDIVDNPKLRPLLIDFLIQEAKNNAPELKNIDYNLEATKRSFRLNNMGRFVPTVSLQGQYNLIFSRSGAGSTFPALFPAIPDGAYNLGVNVSLPIFQQNQRNINQQTAKITEDQLNLQKDNTLLTLEQNVNSIVLDLINQIANIDLSKVSEEAAKEALELVQNEYQRGAVPVIQLIDAQNNYLQAQLASATANYDYLLTSMQLERIIGYFFLMHNETENQEFISRANQFILSKQ